jgi:hypothetical protein
MKQPTISLKLTVVSGILTLLVLLSWSAFAQTKELVISVYNRTNQEKTNFTLAKSAIKREVSSAIEDYHSKQTKFVFTILKNSILAYTSKIDGQLKKIGYFRTIVEEIEKSPAISYEYFATYPEAKIQEISVVNDSLEFEEANNFGITAVVLNSNLIPQKELERRQKDLDKEFSKIYNRLQNGKENANWSLLEQIAYDLARSMCNEGLFKSGRPAAYFVTPIGLIDQILKQPVNLIGKAQVKSALKKLAKLKKLKADLQLAQKLYEKEYLVKE